MDCAPVVRPMPHGKAHVTQKYSAKWLPNRSLGPLAPQKVTTITYTSAPWSYDTRKDISGVKRENIIGLFEFKIKDAFNGVSHDRFAKRLRSRGIPETTGREIAAFLHGKADAGREVHHMQEIRMN